MAITLSKHVLHMLMEARKQCRVPLDHGLATIAVILEVGKPCNKCASYRLISLLNVEVKTPAKVLVIKLKRAIPTLVHPDQSGFMPKRGTKLNLCRLHGVLGDNK